MTMNRFPITSRVRITAAVLLAAMPIVAAAQSAGFSHQSANYRVTTDVSQQLAEQAAAILESGIGLFNELYHFDTDTLPAKMRVRVFASKSDYDSYLRSLIDETRDDYVYVHYNDISRSELVGYMRDTDFARSLLHLGSIQLLKTFVPRAPLWMREGIAAYLENAALDLNRSTFTWRPNLAWLDTYKTIINGEHAASAIPLGQLLTLDSEDVIQENDAFYPQAWALVHFLQQSPDKRVNRILWDAIAALEADRDLRQNSAAVVNRAFSWTAIDELERQERTFTLGLRTFNDLIASGIEAYGREDLATAESDFAQALDLEAASYVPHYYLGLINYANRRYVEAEQFYGDALSRSDDPALVRYALGVNAFADNRFPVATSNLNLAKELDVRAYGEKVDALIQRISVLQ
jgi:hypothetical protein